MRIFAPKIVTLTSILAKCVLLLMLSETLPVLGSEASTAPPNSLNPYIIKAVNYLAKNYAMQGYGQSAYSHNLKYGSAEIPAGPKAPATMCVAAVAEVIITALQFYMNDTGDQTPITYLPVEGWLRLRPIDIRSHIWVDPHLQSYGTADALSTYGVGRHQSFSQLTPGSFVNFNRVNGTGHAVVFVAYIDNKGQELSTYSNKVAGFKYFSSQGRTGAQGSGFGYKYAFFNVDGKRYCPKLGKQKRIDCDIIYSFSPRLLNSGYMLMPSAWDSSYRDQSLANLAEKLYRQNYSRGATEERLPGMRFGISREKFMKLLRDKDTMSLNPQYDSEDMPDDSP